MLFWILMAGREAGEAARANAPAGTESRATHRQTLRLGLNLAADSALHAAAQRFADEVAARSHGALTVAVHPDQQLGSDEQMLEMARRGELDLILTPTAKLSAAVPAMQYADLPFYFNGREELYAMLDGEPGQMLLSKLAAIGLVGITFWENGFKQFTANRPIRSPEDFARLRIRTMKSRIIADQFTRLGAQPIPIDFHATYQALADGAVDGQENPLVAIVGMGFHKVQKHLTLSNHAYLGYVFSASRKVFEGLSPEARDIISRTARELTVWEREETARREAGFIEAIRTAGVQIHTLSPEERTRFQVALAPLADRFGFDVGYDLLAKTEELRFSKRAKEGPEPLVVGLDADLSGGGAQAGGAIFRGMELAAQDINGKGGLLGRPLRIIARDNAANPSLGRQNVEAFARLPQTVAVMGGMHSAVIQAEHEAIHLLNMPYLVPWAAGSGTLKHDFEPNFLFRLSIDDAQVAPFLMERALKAGSKVAVLLERSTWGRSMEAALQPHLDRLPPGSVSIDWITIGETSFAEHMAGLQANGVKALVLVANSRESRAIVKAVAALPQPLPIFAHWGLTGGNFWEENQAELKKVDLRFVQSILLGDAERRPPLARLIQAYRSRYGLNANDPIPAPIGTIQAYDLMQLLARAVAQAGGTDRAAIRQALENLKPYPGVLRNYSPAFTRARHDALEHPSLFLARFNGQGHIVSAE